MSKEKEGNSPVASGGYVPDRATGHKVRQLELQHSTWRLQMWLQYGVLTLAVVGIMFLAWNGKLDATVATLLATLLGYVLRSTQDKRPPADT